MDLTFSPALAEPAYGILQPPFLVEDRIAVLDLAASRPPGRPLGAA
jgi:hypothetical protein